MKIGSVVIDRNDFDPMWAFRREGVPPGNRFCVVDTGHEVTEAR